MFRKTLLVLSLTTVLSQAHATASYAATLSESVSQAVLQHPAIEAGKATREAARKNVWEANSAFFPVVNAQARAGRVHADDDTTRANTGSDAYSWLGEGTLTLTQPLFAGFGNVSRKDAAEDRLSAAAEDLGGQAEDVALKAARAHLNLMRTKELLDLASRYLADIQSRKDNISLMVSEGAADEAEQLLAEEILMAARTTRLGYEEAFRQAEADYIEAVGGAPGESLEFGDSTWDKSVPDTIDNAIAAASAANPRLISADKILSALQSETKAERGALYPRMDAEATYTERDQDDDLGGELANAQAMLKMSWSFSTGGAQFARIGKGVEQQNEARARRKGILQTIEHDVRQKFTSMKIVDEQFDLFVKRQQANERIVENYLSQFEGGKQTNLQLINAHARLFESQAARTDAYYRRLLSRFELLNVMGKLRGALSVQAQTASGVD